MDFVCIVIFQILYYLKPQEWAGFLNNIRFVPIVIVASVASMFLGGKNTSLKDFFRTPHDWAMYAFFAWIVVASPSPLDTFREFSNRLIFYVVIVQTLTTWPRLTKYLGWWCGVIVAVAALALISEYVIDPLGSRDITHGSMKDRLILNISMFNNPNALGHSVVPVLPMLYYFCIWKRPFFMKQIGLATFVVPLWCVYLTFSKGAYLAGAATLLATFMFGRPKFIQIGILVLTMVGGITAIQMLPRMNELQKSKTDEAIQGRIRAFTYGKDYYDRGTLGRGVGQGNFIKSVLHDHNYYKASHSTYVQTGAELGRAGMFLFLLLMWTCARTLLFAETQNPEQERVRRILFVLLLTYCISGWMVDFAYRPYFFMLAAAVGAFHRMLYLHREIEAEKLEVEQANAPARWLSASGAEPVVAPMVIPIAVAKAPPVMPWLRRTEEEAPEPAESGNAAAAMEEKSFWNRLGFLDVATTVILLVVIERIWVYAIHNV